MKRDLPFAIALVIILATWIQTPAQSEGKDWLTDMDRAMQQAQAEDKDLILDFTGSDWCGWCMRLNEEVFSKPEFEKVKEDFVLVELDFPQDESKISAETREQNEAWQQKLGVEGFPTIFLTDAHGRPYAMTGYRDGGVGPYVEHLAELQRIREIRDEAFAAAHQAEGVQKAKHLHEGLSAMRGEFVIDNYRDEIEQVIALDASNQAGLQEQYSELLAEADARRHMQELQARLHAIVSEEPDGGIDAAIKLLQTELTAAKENAALRRQIQTMLVNFLAAAGQFDEAVSLVDQLLAGGEIAEDEKLNLGVQKAYLLVQAGQTKEAVEQFEQLIAGLDNPEIKANLVFTKGQVLQSAGHNEEALAAYEQLAKLGEKGAQFWVYGQQYRGNLLEELGRAEEAVAVYDEMLSVESLQMPFRINALARKASAELAAGDRAAAKATATQAKELATALGSDELSQPWLEEANRRIEAVLSEVGAS